MRNKYQSAENPNVILHQVLQDFERKRINERGREYAVGEGIKPDVALPELPLVVWHTEQYP